MRASVIIATRDRQALLASTLEALVRQQFPRDMYEVLVADNGSTDNTRGVIERFAAEAPISIRYLYVERPGKSHAVNAAFSVARGKVLALTDDDVVPVSSWLTALVETVEGTGSDFAAGRILPAWEVEPPSWMSPALYGALAIPDNGDERRTIALGAGEEAMPIGANMAVTREVVKRIGGLRTDLGKLGGSFRTGEDHEFFLRMLHAGCQGVYEPAALVRHRVPRERLDRRYFHGWLYQNGRDVAQVERRYPRAEPRLLGVPRYLWRRAAADFWQVFAQRDPAARFAAAVRMSWVRGYVRESWTRQRPAAASAPVQLSTCR